MWTLHSYLNDTLHTLISSLLRGEGSPENPHQGNPLLFRWFPVTFFDPEKLLEGCNPASLFPQKMDADKRGMPATFFLVAKGIHPNEDSAGK